MATMKCGYLITSTASEQELIQDQAVSTNDKIQCHWVSGSVQLGVGDQGGPNVITGDGNYATLTLVTDRVDITVTQGKRSLRCKGAGTFRVTW